MTDVLATEKFSVDDFFDLFIAALVLRGKTSIHFRGPGFPEEQRRMQALYKYLDELVMTSHGVRSLLDPGVYRFYVNLRNMTNPGPIGSFERFLHQVRLKMMTIVDITVPFGETYDFSLSEVTARSYLDRAQPRMRKIVDEAAEAYMGAV